jgi:protein-disulfide isomerase
MKWLRRVSAETAGATVVVTLCVASLVAVWHRKSSFPEASSTPDHIGELLSIADASTMGNASATVMLVVFTDYQCPFCRRFALNLLPAVVTTYVDTGRVTVAILNSPIAAIHPLAVGAAETAECAAQAGRFWRMHDLLFRNQRSLDSAARLATLWSDVGLASGRLVACQAEGDARARVMAQSARAKAFDLKGTPTIVVGQRTGAGDSVHVIRRFDGIPGQDELFGALDDALHKE